MLRGMFDHNRSRVVVDGSKGKWFNNKVGLMQGSSLSPLLYALFIDDLPKMLLRTGFPSVPLGATTINAILYADDIALVAESVETCKFMLDYCTYLLKRGISSGVHENVRYSFQLLQPPTSPFDVTGGGAYGMQEL